MSTVFVERDNGGAIKGIYANPQPGLAEEEIDASHPSVVAYLKPAWRPDALMKVVKAGREIALNRLAGIAFAAREAGDSVTVLASLAARQSLLDITKLPAVLAATDDASLTLAIGIGYAAIVGACPANIKNAFAGIQT